MYILESILVTSVSVKATIVGATSRTHHQLPVNRLGDQLFHHLLGYLDREATAGRHRYVVGRHRRM